MKKSNPSDSASLVGLTPIQRQLSQIIRGRPEHVSILSDDYARVMGDVQITAAMLKAAVLRMTITNGLTYVGERGLFSDILPPYVPATTLELRDKNQAGETGLPAHSKRFPAVRTDKECIIKVVYDKEKLPDGKPRPDGKDLPRRLLGPHSNSPTLVLDALLGVNENAIVVVEDFHFFLTKEFPQACIRFREVLQSLRQRQDVAVVVLTVGPTRNLPDNMRGSTIAIDYPLPTDHEITEIVDQLVTAAEGRGVAVALNKTSGSQIHSALTGLSKRSIETALAQTVARNGAINADLVPMLLKEREHLFRSIAGGAAEFITPPPHFRMAGCENFKRWARLQAAILAKGDRQVPLTRGVLLVGGPGQGKTTLSRWLSAETGLPLIKVSMGDLGGSDSSKLGAIPAAMRAVLAGAKAIRSCILLLDDFLKAVDSTDNAKRGGGTIEHSRAVQVLLEWTEDRGDTQIVLFGTGNLGDLNAEFPEGLLERFPKKFRTSKPTAPMRAEIFEIEIAKHGYRSESFDVQVLAAHTDSWVGRQIRDIVEASVGHAFALGSELQTEHILDCIRDSEVQAETLGGYQFEPVDSAPAGALEPVQAEAESPDQTLLSLFQTA